MPGMKPLSALLLALLPASALAAPSGGVILREVPAPFRGGWDERAEGCAGPEPRFSITARRVWNFEVGYEVIRVRRLSWGEIEIVARLDHEGRASAGEEITWSFRLTDGGQAIAGDGVNFRRCANPVNRE